VSHASKPGDPDYVIFPPPHTGEMGDHALIEAAANAIVRLFEAGASISRESAQRAIIEAESKRRIEEFRTCMGLLETQLDSANNLELERQRSYFAVAHRLVELGHVDASLVVLEKVSKEGRTSLVQPLIDYHRTITLGMVK
jgi:hypothetical protein